MIIAKLLQLVECMCSRLCSDFPLNLPFFLEVSHKLS